MSVYGGLPAALSLCSLLLSVRLPSRAGLLPRESPRTSTSMPGPFRAIREAAASRRRALGAVSGTSANGGGIDALRWVLVGAGGSEPHEAREAHQPHKLPRPRQREVLPNSRAVLP